MQWIITIDKGSFTDDEGQPRAFAAVISDESRVRGMGNSLNEAIDDLLTQLDDLATDDEICPPINGR